MDIKTPKRLDVTSEHIFARLAKSAADVENDCGRKVLNFGAGTPDVQPAKAYIDKLSELYKLPNAHDYPGFQATPDFAAALQSWYKQRFSVTVGNDELLPLLGAKDGITHLPLALFDPGDEVLVPDPGYPSFSDPATLLGAVPVAYDLKAADDFKIDLNTIAQKVTPKTKAIWVNFPSNPTGQVAKLEELTNLVDFARSHEIIVLYDNAYSEICFGDFTAPSILQVEGSKGIAIEVGTFSKSFSFAGFRMGWIVGNPDIIKALRKVKSQMDSGMSLPLQGLGAFALTQTDTDWYNTMIDSYAKRREIIALQLKKLGLKFDLPKGSLYIWAKIPDNVGSSEEFCEKLLREKHILLTPGTAYGRNGEGYVRVSICVNIDKIGDYF